MKIRTGFVSNSSSSSFCCYGAALDYDEYKKLLEDNGYEIYDDEEFLHDNEVNLSTYGRFDECYPIYLGLSPQKIQDNETGAEFKQRVKKEVKEFCEKFGIENPKHVDWASDGWYNG